VSLLTTLHKPLCHPLELNQSVLKKNKKSVDIGDRFVKTDDPTTVWVVAGHGAPISALPHFQVTREDSSNRVRTLSEQVLLDPDFYQRIK